MTIKTQSKKNKIIPLWKEEDLQIEVFKMPDDSILEGCSAVRIIHIPTGIIICASGSKDVSENTKVALNGLGEKLKESKELKMSETVISRKYPVRKSHPDALKALTAHNKHAKSPLTLPSGQPLPLTMDLRLRNGMPNVYDQGHLGSCSANALCGAYELLLCRKDLSLNFMPSRLFTYYNELAREPGGLTSDGVPTDAGLSTSLTIPIMITVGAEVGFCPDSDWPYEQNVNTFTSVVPDEEMLAKCTNDAIGHTITKFINISTDEGAPDLDLIKHALFQGCPVAFGFTVYESFESAELAKTGIMKMPRHAERCLGGHAVVIVGYNDNTEYLTVRNSWGPLWGKKGYFQMPYSFLEYPDTHPDGFGETYCFDFIALQEVSDKVA